METNSCFGECGGEEEEDIPKGRGLFLPLNKGIDPTALCALRFLCKILLAVKSRIFSVLNDVFS